MHPSTRTDTDQIRFNTICGKGSFKQKTESYRRPRPYLRSLISGRCRASFTSIWETSGGPRARIMYTQQGTSDMCHCRSYRWAKLTPQSWTAQTLVEWSPPWLETRAAAHQISMVPYGSRTRCSIKMEASLPMPPVHWRRYSVSSRSEDNVTKDKKLKTGRGSASTASTATQC